MRLIAIIIMTFVSFFNLFGLQIAGVSVIIGVVFFFINKALEKQSFDSGFDMKAIGFSFKDTGIWLWFFMPLIMDAVSITIAKFFSKAISSLAKALFEFIK